MSIRLQNKFYDGKLDGWGEVDIFDWTGVSVGIGKIQSISYMVRFSEDRSARLMYWALIFVCRKMLAMKDVSVVSFATDISGNYSFRMRFKLTIPLD